MIGTIIAFTMAGAFLFVVLHYPVTRLIWIARIVSRRPSLNCRPPEVQCYLPRRWGMYYVEYPALGHTTGLMCLPSAVTLCANFLDEGARVLRHPRAPWWSFFFIPRAGIIA